MVKIINKTKMPVRVDEIPVGECFILNGEVYMRVRYYSADKSKLTGETVDETDAAIEKITFNSVTDTDGYASVRFASGVVQTNIHADQKVQPVNVTIEVG